MESIKIFLIICGPILGLISFILLRHYNSGLGGSLYSKRWYLRIGITIFLFSLTSFIFYFIIPNRQEKVYENQSIVKIEEAKKRVNELDKQIKNLNVEVEERKLLLEKLQSEQEKLESIVKAERKVLKSLLEFNEKQKLKQKRLNIVITLIMGIISSLIAHVILEILKK